MAGPRKELEELAELTRDHPSLRLMHCSSVLADTAKDQ